LATLPGIVYATIQCRVQYRLTQQQQRHTINGQLLDASYEQKDPFEYQLIYGVINDGSSKLKWKDIRMLFR